MYKVLYRVNKVAIAISQKLLPNTSKGTFNNLKDPETPSFFLIGQKLSRRKFLWQVFNIYLKVGKPITENSPLCFTFSFNSIMPLFDFFVFLNRCFFSLLPLNGDILSVWATQHLKWATPHPDLSYTASFLTVLFLASHTGFFSRQKLKHWKSSLRLKNLKNNFCVDPSNGQNRKSFSLESHSLRIFDLVLDWENILILASDRLVAVLGIRDFLVRIRGSEPLINGSGSNSGFDFFLQWLKGYKKKFSPFFYLYLNHWHIIFSLNNLIFF